MKQASGKLGIREYVSIAILMVGSRATEDTPTHIYNQVQNAGWMIPILSACLFFIPLFLLVKTLSLFKDKHLFSVIQTLLGKYIGFIVCLLVFLISSYAISFDTRVYTNIISSFYFTTTPNIIIYAILIGVCAYGAKKGIQHVGSVSYLLVFYALASLYLALILSAKDSTFRAIFPVWGPGIPHIARSSFNDTSLYTDFFLFAMLIPYIRSFKNFRQGTWIAFTFAAIQISVTIFIFISLFDKTMATIGYPFHTALLYISMGSYLPNVEIIFFIIWLLSAFIRFAAFLYINALMFGHLFKIKDFEYLIPSLAILYLLIGSIPEAPVQVAGEIKPFIVLAAGPIFAAISFLLWLVAWVKGEFKHAKNKNSM